MVGFDNAITAATQRMKDAHDAISKEATALAAERGKDISGADTTK